MSNATNWLDHNGFLSEILYCHRVNGPGADAQMSPAVAGGFACPCHLCLCAWTSWRWHGALGLCVLLQGAKSFCNPSQGHCSCILVTCCQRCRRRRRHRAKYEVLKGPFGVFSSVDLSSDAGCIITERRWKDGENIEWKLSPSYCGSYSHGKCLLPAIWQAPFSCQYQFNTSNGGRARHKRFQLRTSNY